MIEVIVEAFWDTIKIIPLLFVVYFAIEFIEFKWGSAIRNKIQKAGSAGPGIGALAGSVPQCGFSVIATALYTQKLVTIGTLLAVYLSTSDEAIPVIMSQPDKIGVLLPLVLTKIIIAIIAGYAIDFIFKGNNRQILSHIEAYAHNNDDASHNHESIDQEQSCCGHHSIIQEQKFSFRELFFHPLVHTAKIFLFIFIISALINLLFFIVGEQFLITLFSQYKFFQPFVVSLIGLIPNCAASVAITQLYLDGVITYGAVIAGLCASGGLGILLLFKESKQRKQAFKIIIMLYAISVLAGIIINYINI